MAFGLKYVTGGEADKARSLKKSLQEQSQDEGEAQNAPPASIASRFQRGVSAPTAAAARAPSVATAPTGKPVQSSAPSSPARPSPINKFLKARKRVDDEGDVTPEMYSELPSTRVDDEDHQTEVTVADTEQYGPTKQQLLGLRARRLVQEVGEFKKWPLDEIVALERRALREPQVVIDELLPAYRSEIQPHRQQGAHSLEDGLKKHPNDTVFLLIKGDKHKLRVLPSGTADEVLKGAVLESLQANSTPFDKPCLVLPKAKPEEPAPAPSAPKPPR